MNGIDQIGGRLKFGRWLNNNGLTGHGAEIGCAYGAYAKELLSSWRGAKYFMVDLWALQPKSIYKEGQEECEKYLVWYEECIELAKNDSRITILRADSVVASHAVQDCSLDFVYIDANHDYGPVLADMDAWFPKVKSGGVFCGHDYYDHIKEPYHNLVKSAVDRWMAEHEIAFVHTKECSSWWSIKP